MVEHATSIPYESSQERGCTFMCTYRDATKPCQSTSSVQTSASTRRLGRQLWCPSLGHTVPLESIGSIMWLGSVSHLEAGNIAKFLWFVAAGRTNFHIKPIRQLTRSEEIVNSTKRRENGLMYDQSVTLPITTRAMDSFFLTAPHSAPAAAMGPLFSWCPSRSVVPFTSGARGGNGFQGVSLDLLPSFCRRAQRSILVLSGGQGARASSVVGQHVIITGANSGIGKATALELAKKGMVVTLACRNEKSGEAAAREVAQASRNASVRSMVVDLESLQSVRQFAAEYKDTGLPLHVLVNNAGIMACPENYTEDDFERQLGVNHLGHFLLTALLLDNLVASASADKKSRVVVLSSAAERIGEIDFTDLNYKGARVYNNWGAYGQSKLANCLFSYELATRSRNFGLPIISNSMHPGIVNTNLIRYVFPNVTRMGQLPPIVEGLARSFFRLFGLKTPEEGASTAIFLASSPEVENSSGLYYEDCKASTPSLNARSPRLASQLWDVSVELTGASSALESLGLAKQKSTIA